MNHFDEMACMLYLDQQLEPERARELIHHTSTCAQCRALLRSLEAEGTWLRAALAEDVEMVPVRLAQPPARSRTPWGWIIAFGLAASGFYTLWNGLIAPWRQQLSDAGLNGSNLLAVLVFHGAFWKGWNSMRSLIEFIALAILITVVVGFSRRHWRRGTSVAFMVAAMLCGLGLPQTITAAPQAADQSQSQAAEHGAVKVSVGNGPSSLVDVNIKGEANYTLPAGETHHGDLIVYCNFARIDGTVEGDVIAFAQDVEVAGHVEGDVIGFARDLRVTGQVDGNVRVYSQLLTISGKVGHNVTAAGEVFELGQSGSIGWSLLFAGREADLSGSISRNLMAAADTTDISGILGGSARLVGSRLTIGPNADIRGAINFRGEKPPEVSPGAKLASPVEFTTKKRETPYRKSSYWLHQVLLWGAAFVLGLVLLVLLPRLFDRVTRAGREPGALIGILALPGVPIIAIIACITLVGIPVGILALMLWLVALYTSQIFVGEIIGEKLLGSASSFGATLGRLALGLLIVHALELIPHVGGWVSFIVMVWGVGALSMALFRSARSTIATTAAA
jgi:cytoskeletal protein CcmA (bactofilin family)